MKDKTKMQLTDELSQLHQRIKKLEAMCKRVKKELQESEECYQNFIESARDAIYTLSLNGTLTSLNPAFENITGLSSDEWLGKQFSSIIHPDDLSAAMDSIQRVLLGEETPPFIELRILSKSGEYIIGEFRSSVKLKNGEVIGIQGIAHDITERKLTQEKLEQYREHLEELVVARTNELIKSNEQLQQEITERKQAEEKLQHILEKIRRSLEGTVNALSAAVEKRDPYTSGHQQRVARLAIAIAQEISLPKEQIDGVRIAGQLHDIGKITVPAEILSKPGKLTEIEFNLIKIHSQSGYDILKEIEFPWQIAKIVLQHHELIDGSGYPSGLSGEDILLEAKILVVADVVEAMSSHRPYRPVRGLDKAVEQISKNKGILYDTEVVDACINLFNKKSFTFS